MRWIVLTVLLASRVAAASGNPTIDAADLDFGIVPAGTPAIRYVDISNTDTVPRSPLAVTQATFGNNGAGWFSFGGNGCSGTVTCTFSPALSITDLAALVAIRCAPPAGATGTQYATLTFTSNTVNPSHPTAMLACTAGEGQLVAVPSSIDFGPIDLDRVPVATSAPIQLRNTGTATVTTGTMLVLGPDPARFTFGGSLAPHVIPPGGHVDLVVTYTAIQERSPADPDFAYLWVPLTGTVDNAPLEVNFRGHGTNRHASIGAVPTFVDGFVNPGPAAQVMPLYVGNSGEAPLALTHPTISGAPVWSIDNPDPVDVPGNSMFPYQIRFAPSAAGPAPPATFTVTTNDRAKPTLTVVLTGGGKARDVAIAAPIDMHYAGVGTTVRLSDGTRGDYLAVQNLDPVHAFTIRALVVLGGEDAFAIDGAKGIDLPAGETRTFDVSFTPAHEGVYDAIAYLYLDSNPMPQAQVAVHGEGVFVEARGGVGCATTGGAGAGMVVAIVFFVLVRRRRVAALVLVSATAHADTRNLDLAIFDPTPSTAASSFQVQSAEVGREGDWAATALVSYANDPLVLQAPPNTNIAIQDRMTLALGGAFAFGDRFETGARMPVYLQSGQNLNGPTMFGEPTAAGTVRGDLTVHAKARLARAGITTVGTSLALGLPTASTSMWTCGLPLPANCSSLATVAPAPEIAAYANAGAVIRAAAQWHDVTQGSGLAWGVGATYRARHDLVLDGEVFGELVPGGVRDGAGATHALDTTEALVGVHYQIERRVNVGLALGRGVSSGIGAPAARGVLAVTFTPAVAPPVIAHRAAGDTDRDGIPDDLDRCPTEPEDKDGYEDDDGCPDLDNDGDGVPDARDKCPNQPEDRDGFEDDDGCPDLDNDHDGIPDRFDHCPNEPETINGIDDEDGCPDKGEGLVKLDGDHLVLAEAIQFTAEGKVAPASFNVMGQLGATLRAHAELIKVRIVAHALALHAQAVIDWLVQYGIARDRLDATSWLDASDEQIDIVIVDRY